MNTNAIDKFGNPHAPGLPYARGEIVTSTEDDLTKLNAAWKLIRKRVDELGVDGVFMLSGLERSLQLDSNDLSMLDDELAPAMCADELTELALEHFGGETARHDVMVLNRMTGALLLAADVMIAAGDTVIGVSPRYSHPAVVRAVAHARAKFVDTMGIDEFRRALDETDDVSTIVITRLSVSYEIMSTDDLREIVRLAQAAGARIIVDDAGGARVGPAMFDQPRTLELGVDIATTGLDKYGTLGPRLGLLAGDKAIVGKVRARAFEMGLEARPMLYPAVVKSLRAYTPERVRELVATTLSVGEELESRLGAERLFQTPVTAQLRGEDILELAMQRGRVNAAPIVPYEATAALAMLLLRDYGVLTVHFAGMPPGTSALMIKFVPPDTLARFGGPARLAQAIDDSITELGETLMRPQALRVLLLGSPRG